jgi:murein DD-endopeptidase MepM/ murein hydrolase activator NlpD
LTDLPGTVANPYDPPKPGRDDPHAGVDLADRSPGTQIALSGRAVQSALAGRVALVIRDRFPFGNAVLVETPLDEVPGIDTVTLPTPALTPAVIPALTCPAIPSLALEETTTRSLYLLYAHLQASPEFRAGDGVSCGQSLGSVGDSGNALNPHLHLEARVGPSGLRLDSMAHYDDSATQTEMASYCLWSVSGAFQLVNPLEILENKN